MSTFFLVLGIVLLSLLLLIVLILLINVNLTFLYETEPLLYVRVLFLRFNLTKLIKKMMSKEKDPEKERLKQEKKEQKKKKKEEEAQGGEKAKGSPLDFMEFLLVMGRVVRLTLVYAMKHLYFKLPMLRLVFGTEDAAKTALLYGGLTGAASLLFETLQEFSNFTFDPENVVFTPNFVGGPTELKVKLHLRIRLLDALKILIYFNTSYQEGKEGLA